MLIGTGDGIRSDKSHVEYLLSRGKRVVMVYGDRDYRCNWLGAEAISLSLDFPGKKQFAEAGYAEIDTNGSYIGGVTRQAGNLAFNRVFEAGHYAAADQPETVYRIVERSLRGVDVASGKVHVEGGKGKEGCGFQTKGPRDSWAWRNVLPESKGVMCSVRFVNTTCTEHQAAALADGTAVVRNEVVVSPAS